MKLWIFQVVELGGTQMRSKLLLEGAGFQEKKHDVGRDSTKWY